MLIPSVEDYRSWRSILQMVMSGGMRNVRRKGLINERGQARPSGPLAKQSGEKLNTYDDALRETGQRLREAWGAFNILFSDLDKEQIEWTQLTYQRQEQAWNLALSQLVATAEMPEHLLLGRTVSNGGLLRKDDEIGKEQVLVSATQGEMLPALQALVGYSLLAKDGPCSGNPPKGWEVKFRDRYPRPPMEVARTRQIDANTLKILNDIALASGSPLVTRENLLPVLGDTAVPENLLDAIQVGELGDIEQGARSQLEALISQSNRDNIEATRAAEARVLLQRDRWQPKDFARASQLINL